MKTESLSACDKFIIDALRGRMPDSPDFHSWFWFVASISFFAEKLEEQLNSMLLFIEDVHLLLAVCPDPPPTAHQRHFSKECRLDGKRIEPCHILLRLDTLDIKVIGLNDHLRRIARSDSGVQSEF